MGELSVGKLLDRVSISLKLWLLAGVMAVLLINQFAFTRHYFGLTETNTSRAANASQILISVNDMRADFYSLDGALNMYLMVPGGPLAQSTLKSYQTSRADFQSSYASAIAHANPAERQSLALVGKAFTGYQGIAGQMFQAVAAHQLKQAIYDQTQANADVSNQLSSALDNLAGAFNRQITQNTAQTYSVVTSANRSLDLVFVFGMVILALGIGLISSTASRLNRNIGVLKNSVSQLTSGNLRTEIPITSRDEIGQISVALGHMATQMAETMGHSLATAEALLSGSEQLKRTAEEAARATSQITLTVQQVATGSSQGAEGTTRASQLMDTLATAITRIATGSQELIRVTGQAASSMNDIASAIQQANRSAENVVHTARSAETTANESGQIVQATIAGMLELRKVTQTSAEKVRVLGQHSSEIENIVNAIAEISGQTNLLALNATIEAARAGEHGRGFAVVADEVRRLAERSATSAKEINVLVRTMQGSIGDAIEAMEDGSRKSHEKSEMAREAASALERIVRAIQDINSQSGTVSEANAIIAEKSGVLVEIIDGVTAAIQDNTTASQEMLAESKLVMDHISDVAALSEENASAAQEISATTEELSGSTEEVSASASMLAGTAEELKRRLAFFQV